MPKFHLLGLILFLELNDQALEIDNIFRFLTVSIIKN
jgi:hypothetical protein